MDIEEWWATKLHQGEIFTGSGWPGGIESKELIEDYRKHVCPEGSSLKAAGSVLGRFLSKACRGIQSYYIVSPGTKKRLHCYGLPKLWKAKRSWEFYKGEDVWTEDREFG